MTDLELKGLEADNLLAFLALLGLLRALEATRPEWEPRAAWSGPPWRVRLRLLAETDEDTVAEVAHRGILALGTVAEFGEHRNIDYTRDECREYAQTQAVAATSEERTGAEFVAALASEANLRRGGRVEGTALCALYGQGHQNFLERVQKLSTSEDEPQNAPGKIADALFDPWKYEDEGITFRWDPAEDRRYALNFADPSGEKIRTVVGANRLAAVGFPVLRCAPHTAGLQTTAFRRAGLRLEISWPLWTPFISLVAVQTMLSHPLLAKVEIDAAQLRPYGVIEVMRAARIQTGKYISFEPARPVFGAASIGGATQSSLA